MANGESTGWDGGIPNLSQSVFLSYIQEGYSVPWADGTKRVQIASLTDNGTDWYGFNYQDNGVTTYGQFVGYAGSGKQGGIGARPVSSQGAWISTSPLSATPFNGGGATYGGGGGGGGGFVGGNGGSVRSGWGRKDGFHPVGYGGIGGISQAAGFTKDLAYSLGNEPQKNGEATLYFYYDANYPPVNTTITFSLFGLTQTYDGSAKTISATSAPVAGINYAVTYNGSATPPILAGTYAVTVIANQSGYTGNSSGTMYIYSPLTTQVGLGNGTVTGSGSYLPGQSASINATPSTNWQFSSWSVAGTGTLNSATTTASNSVTLSNTFTTATANFTRIIRNLTVTATSGIGASTSPSGTNSVNQGDTYTLTPFQTAADWYFDHWDQTDAFGVVLQNLGTATDATPLPTASLTIGAQDYYAKAIYLQKTDTTLTGTFPNPIARTSNPVVLTATTNSTAPVTYTMRSVTQNAEPTPGPIATLSGSTLTLTDPRTQGLVGITMSVAATRTHRAKSVDADIVMSDGGAPITVTEASASRIVMPGARVSANQVPQQIVNAYSDPVLMGLVASSWKTANPQHSTETISQYLQRYLSSQIDAGAAMASLINTASSSGLQTEYQTIIAQKVADAAAAANPGDGTTNPGGGTTPTPPTIGGSGTSSSPYTGYTSVTALQTAVPPSLQTNGQYATIGGSTYKVERTVPSPPKFDWIKQ